MHQLGAQMSPALKTSGGPPEPPGRTPRPGGQTRPSGARPRWMPWVIVALIVALFLVWQATTGQRGATAVQASTTASS